MIVDNLLLILQQISCMAWASDLTIMCPFVLHELSQKNILLFLQSKRFSLVIVGQIPVWQQRKHKRLCQYLHIKVYYTYFDFEILLASGVQ